MTLKEHIYRRVMERINFSFGDSSGALFDTTFEDERFHEEIAAAIEYAFEEYNTSSVPQK